MTRIQTLSFYEAYEALRAGKPIVFPTDTVYGLGVACLHSPSPQVLIDLKHRDPGKPIAWLIADVDDLYIYGDEISDITSELAQKFWPGPLTLVVKASRNVPKTYQSSDGTIGLRVPACESIRHLIRALGSPLATTSANLSNDAASKSFEELPSEIVDAAGVFFCDISSICGIASTVLDCTHPGPILFRDGAISEKRLQRFLKSRHPTL